MEALERALRFLWEGEEVVADEVERIPQGTVLRTPSLAHYWSGNTLRLEGPHPNLTLADAVALAAAHVPHVGYRHLGVEDEATGERLAAAARAEGGWRVDRELLMRLDRPAEREPGEAPVREATVEEVVELLDAWNREEFPEQSEEAHRTLRDAGERAYRAGPWQHFVATDDAGRPAAMCSLLVQDGVAQVEDVFTLPDARGKGLGGAVTAHVVERARAGGHDLAFIVADAADWPQRLYGKLGFDRLGERYALHREPRDD